MNFRSVCKLNCLGLFLVAIIISACKEVPIKVGGQPSAPQSGGLDYTVDSDGNIVYTQKNDDPTKTDDGTAKTDGDPKIEVLPKKGPFNNALMCHVRGSTVCATPAKTVVAKKVGTKSKISGHVFLDLNKNGVRDLGEKGLSIQGLYVDVNNNCVFDNEDFAINGPFNLSTGYYETYGKVKNISNGVYNYEPMPTGEVTIRMQEWVSHYAGDGYPAYKTTLGENGEVDNINFAVTTEKNVDRGSAPAYYGEATHNFNQYYYLGKNVSANPDASVCKSNDGITFPPNLKFNSNVYISVVMTGNGASINGWIDANGDGDFDDEGERVIIGPNGLGEGVFGYGGFAETGQQVLIKIPPASPNVANKIKTWARFRIGEGLASPIGHSQIGEVEDYEIEISR